MMVKNLVEKGEARVAWGTPIDPGNLHLQSSAFQTKNLHFPLHAWCVFFWAFLANKKTTVSEVSAVGAVMYSCAKYRPELGFSKNKQIFNETVRIFF